MPWYRGPTLLSSRAGRVGPRRPTRARRFPGPVGLRPAARAAITAATPAARERRVARRRRRRRAAGRHRTRISSIDTYDGEIEGAIAPLSATLRLEDDLDVSRGDLIVAPADRRRGPRVRGRLCWMAATAAAPRRSLRDQAHARTASASSRSSSTASTSTRSSAIAAPPARPQRHRSHHAAHQRAAGLRPLHAQPPHRQLHPDRRGDQRHSRRRHDHRRPLAAPAAAQQLQ